jgi:hypothetical protein
MKRSIKPALGRGIVDNILKAGAVAIAGVCLLPGQAVAQGVNTCNPELNVTVADQIYLINEPVGITVSIGAGEVLTDGSPGYLDIPEFTYDLDCDEADLPNCTPAGNTVVFDEGSVTTNCTDENDAAITFMTTVVGNTVTFTPSPGQYIRNDSEQTCDVNFEVTVTEVADENPLREIVEIAGFASTGETAGICDNGEVAGAESVVRFALATTSSTFLVTKDFLDDNDLPVTVHLRCNTGLPLEQSFEITDPAVNGQWPAVAFVVKAFQPGAMDCQVYEDPVPAGYSESYVADATDGVADDVYEVNDQEGDDNGCFYEGVDSGGFTCVITDAPLPGEFTVTKYWAIAGAEGDEVIEAAYIDISCDDTILSLNGQALGYVTNSIEVLLEGDGDFATIEVDTTDGAATCSASEDITQSGVESDDSDCGPRAIPAGGSSSCEILNTVFFEGIPTLNPLGLVLMAMLMLGVGLVGFRRFA